MTFQEKTTSYRSGRNERVDDEAAQLLVAAKQDSKRPKADNGHTFFNVKDRVALTHPYVNLRGRPGYDSRFYAGPLVPRDPASGWASLDSFAAEFPAYSDSNLNALGSKAIAQSIPTRSIAGLSQFLGELREGLPSLALQSLRHGKGISGATNAVSGEYINYQFGIKPLISDIKKMAKAVLNSTEHINWLIAHSGKPVSGDFSFPAEEMTQSRSTSMSFDRSVSSNYNFDSEDAIYLYKSDYSAPRVTVDSYRSIKRNVWFKGSFIYQLEDGQGLLAKATAYEQLANKLLGTRFTLSTLYELTPWSWLLDWFTDVGDVISNYEAFSQDGLVLRYGYLMSQTRWDIGTTISDPGFASGPTGSISSHFWRTQKQRVRSTPYGFGLQPSSLSDQQWSILGALGMLKAPKLWR
jgi:hypothetical protein